MAIFRANLILILVLVLQVNLFVPFLREPLERDEGAYAYIAQRLRVGEVPYRDSFDHKPPAIYFTYAFIFKYFGESILSIRLFTLLVSLLCTLLIYLIAYWFWGSMGALLAAFLYAVFSGGPFIQGTSANTETFMLLPMLIAFYLFILSIKKNLWDNLALLCAGIFSGLAVMFKPVALLNFLALFLFAFFMPDRSRKEKTLNLINLGLGFLLFPLVFLCYFWTKQALFDFINLAFVYNFTYLHSQLWFWSNYLRVFICANSILWLLAISAAIHIMLKERKYELWLLTIWAALSVLGVISGKSFYGHYFIQAMPALILLSTFTLLKYREERSVNISSITMAVALFALSIIIIIYQYQIYLSPPDKISLIKYGYPNFVVAREVAEYVKAHTAPKDSIYIWGAEPEIYFYSQRKAASKYIYYYPLFNAKELTLKPIVEELARHQPKEIILAAPMIEKSVLADYIKLKYQKIKTFWQWEVWERK